VAGRIPPEFIDQLLARIDIVDVVDRRVPLKKAGAEFQALCPFHSEKSPSFTVSPQKQFYHCFGCGAHGTAISFLMAYDHMSFPEAVETLARDAGLEMPSSSARDASPDYSPVYDTLKRAAQYFIGQLRSHPQASKAVEYLKGRGLTGEIAKDYSIGYAPPGWDLLLKHFGSDDRTLQRLKLAGLTSEGEEGKVYDRFRDRIIFPIHDARGRVIGFGGRVLGDDKPKYLNSPETPVFHKGRELYGLYEARKALRDIPFLLVVEGYMDVVALAQFGIRNVVATLGTATTPDHLERLFRVTPRVIFCFDGDRAGQDAAWKALGTALPALDGSREIRFLFLPQGEDPDSMVRKEGAEGFRRRIEQALPISEFFFDRLKKNIGFTQHIDSKARLAEAAHPLIEKVPSGPFKDLMLQRLKDIAGVVRTQASRSRGGGMTRRTTTSRAATPPSAVRTAIRLLLEDPSLAENADLPDGWQALDMPGIDLLNELLATAAAHPGIHTAALVDRHYDTAAWEPLKKLAASPIDTPKDGLAAEFAGALRQLMHRAEELELERLMTKAKRPSDLSAEEIQRLTELHAKRTR